MSDGGSKVYFPGLNGLRFLAALAVIITHIEMTLKYKGIASYWLWFESKMKFTAFDSIIKGEIKVIDYFVSIFGYCGVTFFFVLSGFLISYLLLVEKQKNGYISVKSFYMRRLLRIWPLYYLLVLIGFFVLPKIDLFDVAIQSAEFAKNFSFNLICYIFMLPNLAAPYMILHVPNIGHLWSIGVEEQFYLLWPFAMSVFIKSKRSILYFIVTLLIVKAIVLFGPFFSNGFIRFIGTLKFEAMAIGALGAFLLFHNKQRLDALLFSRRTQIIAYASVLLILLFLPKQIFETMHLFLSIPFIVIILNVSCNPHSLLKLENSVFNYLGRISFGLYMYHFLVVTFTVNCCYILFKQPFELSFIQRSLIYIISLLLTIGLSSISYHFFEKPFFKLKGKYTKVLSGDVANK